MKKIYTIHYGVISCHENTIKVECEEKDIETVAYAIYHGAIGHGLGVMVVSDGQTERTLADRM